VTVATDHRRVAVPQADRLERASSLVSIVRRTNSIIATDGKIDLSGAILAHD
jgi:hypothetical protein